MVKKLKGWYGAQVKKRHMRWVAQNLPVVTLEISDVLSNQLVKAGVKFAQVNKWRESRGLDPIVCYTRKDGEVIRWLTYVPDTDRQSALRAKGELMFLVY